MNGDFIVFLKIFEEHKPDQKFLNQIRQHGNTFQTSTFISKYYI